MPTRSTFIAAALVAVIAASAAAIPVSPFQNTERFIKQAKDIVIAECTGEKEGQHFIRQFDVEVIYVLKGDCKPGKLTVAALGNLKPGQRYLLASRGGQVGEVNFLAIDELAATPIPKSLALDVLEGKPVITQVHLIFETRKQEIERILAPLLEEKAALEKGLADRKDNLFVSRSIKLGAIGKTDATDWQGDATRFLTIAGHPMEWSVQSDTAGYLYADAPGERGPEWEFASIETADFKQLEGQALTARFSDVHLPPGGKTLVVRPGQMLLVRHVSDRKKIYALRIDSQKDKVIEASYAPVTDRTID